MVEAAAAAMRPIYSDPRARSGDASGAAALRRQDHNHRSRERKWTPPAMSPATSRAASEDSTTACI